MNLRRVGAELRREVLRAGTLRLVAGFSILFSSLALLGMDEEGIELAVELGYYLVPMFMCPYAAHRVLADRDTGMAGVLATTPLTRAEAVTAKVVSVALVPVLAVSASLPVLYGLAAPTAPGAFWTLLIHVPWALTLATTAASIGLVVGHLTPDHRRFGLTLAFLLVPAWFALGTSLSIGPGTGPVLGVLAKLSPMAYVGHATPIGPVPAGDISILAGPLILLAAALAVLATVALGLQHALGWDRPLHEHPVAMSSLAAALAVGGLALGAWEPPANTWGQEVPAQPIETRQAGIDWNVNLMPGEEAGELYLDGWGPDTPMRLSLVAIGPPNATLHLDAFSLSSPKITFEPRGPLPETLTLDGIQQTDNGTIGVGSIEIGWTAQPLEIFQTAQAELTFTADGKPVRIDVGQSALDWRLDGRWILAGSMASILPALAAARWLPRRWHTR